jgi:hypothetical protein
MTRWLGTGKTVMILSLILSTLDELPGPEESILDTRPIQTPVSMRLFATTEARTARQRTSRDGRKVVSQIEDVPTLVEMLLHHAKLNPASSGLRYFEERLQGTNLLPVLAGVTPFYHHFNIDSPEQGSVRRKPAIAGPKVMYVTSATLVVVPPNLVAQWQREIQKHCDDTLKVLTVTKETDIPRPSKLASGYDVSRYHDSPRNK